MSRRTCTRTALIAMPALLTLLASGSAAAQGTMTPTQPPPVAPAATGTPNQPPPTPTQPPPVAPAQPAQPAQPPPAYAAPAGGAGADDDEHPDAPKARTGFQMALRTGVAIPLGDAAKDGKMSDLVGVQVPLIIDIGGKIIPHLFIGGYIGVAFGGAGGTIKETCEKGNLDCSSFGARIGAQIQYHIIPDGKVNPWVGYGIGYELLGLTAEKGSNKSTIAAGGVEFAHLMAGVDFRLTRGFGIGPFADFALGQYSVYTVETNGKDAGNNGEIKDKAMHQWFTLGAKFTFFP